MKIPFSPPDITEAEIEQVAEALRSGWITTGPKTKELEREVADLCGTNRAVCLNSQTACAEMTLRLLGIHEGDEVITCAYTYTASASVVCHVGSKLVLIDTQEDSLEMDYDKLAEAITEKTKVIIPVDLGGVPCDYDRIFSIVEEKKKLFHPVNKLQEAIGRVIVMADAAHAFGATWNGKPVGSIADFSNFSFHAGKFVLFDDGEKIKVGRGVTSLTTLTGKQSPWKKIRVVETMDMINNDIVELAEDNYIGKYQNTYSNKCLLLSAIKTYMDEILVNGLIEDYSIEFDVEKIRKYVIENEKIKKEDAEAMSDEEMQKQYTDEKVYFKATVTISDVMEDIYLDITA